MISSGADISAQAGSNRMAEQEHPGEATDPTVRALDRFEQAASNYDRGVRKHVRSLVTDSLIAEHAEQPVGQHSDALERVLNYVRRTPLAGKYVIVVTKPFEEWRLGVLSGKRGTPAELVPDVTYHSEKEAMHDVFVRRIHELLGIPT